MAMTRPMTRYSQLAALGMCHALLLLSACATREARIAGAELVRSADEVLNWSARGRMAVSGGAQAGSGAFTWTQHNADSVVQLRGPVGVGSLQLSLQNEVPHIVTGDGQQYDAEQALNELQARLGAAIPLTQLRYWLRALPAPGAYQWLAGATKVLQQDGWRIEYQEFAQQGSLQLPTRLSAIQHDANGGELRIRVVIEHWQLQS